MDTIAERIIYLMDRMDMKQTELAEKVGISKQSLYQYLHCKCEPRAEIIARMARVLHSSADFIVGLTNAPGEYERDEKKEAQANRDTELLRRFYRLSEENKIRIEERMETLLEQEQ